jgi:hypothetical protein
LWVIHQVLSYFKDKTNEKKWTAAVSKKYGKKVGSMAHPGVCASTGVCTTSSGTWAGNTNCFSWFVAWDISFPVVESKLPLRARNKQPTWIDRIHLAQTAGFLSAARLVPALKSALDSNPGSILGWLSGALGSLMPGWATWLAPLIAG